ncbi:hypothetical protein JZO72_08240 [Vagococcus fluvialis]|uniref:hypothetical protein n=1 Tax=Vagococcus fluvialis TaxID=2738 RepID=UPI001A8F695E|nr:hypothetical protein [Vagococcus fluvialis]MBO0479618.1 hypothetical protein [Vagococcus fluvialis]MBO0485372.1 hypothetical protein [Vagococcus fluvialis]
MTTYVYDSYGAAVDIVEETPLKIAETWNGQDVHVDETAYTHLAYAKTLSGLTTVKNVVSEDDIHEYVKTLEKADLLEILGNINKEDIIAASNMEEVKSPWK